MENRTTTSRTMKKRWKEIRPLTSIKRNKKISKKHKLNYKLGINKCGFKKGHKINVDRSHIPWNKGLIKETDERVMKSSLKKSKTLKEQYKNGKVPWNKNKRYHCHTEKHKRELSKKFSGKNNPMWRGGKSFEPYGFEWTETLRNVIRERDDYICQICGMFGKIVHHINYNKKKNNPINLITLCFECHNRTNANRKYWENYFKNG